MAGPGTPDREPLSHFIHASASTLAQLNIEDTARLKIMITYQAPMGTQHLEPTTPCAEPDPIRQMIEHMTEESPTQMTFKIIGEVLSKQEPEQQTKAKTETDEVDALKQKTDSTMEKLKTVTAVELARSDLLQRKLADQCEKSIQRQRAMEEKSRMAAELDEGMDKWLSKVCQLISD